MRLKLFVDFGLEGFRKVERDANSWLAANRVKIVRSDVSLCPIRSGDDSEMYQCVVISLWYESKAGD